MDAFAQGPSLLCSCPCKALGHLRNVPIPTWLILKVNYLLVATYNAVAGRAAAEDLQEAAARQMANSDLAWNFGFQCNERYLQWDTSAQARLLKLNCAEQLGWSMDQVCCLCGDCALRGSMLIRFDRIEDVHAASRMSKRARALLCSEHHN